MTTPTYTVAIVKAPTVGRGQLGEVLTEITKAGLSVVSLDYRVLCPTTIAAFYTEHQGRPYYPDLEASVGSGKPVAVMVLSTNQGDAVTKWRSLMGATKSSTAAPGTIRYKFGGHNYLGDAAPIADNAVHGSDSADAAAYEYKVLFGEGWPENPLANIVDNGV